MSKGLIVSDVFIKTLPNQNLPQDSFIQLSIIGNVYVIRFETLDYFRGDGTHHKQICHLRHT